MLKDYFDKKGSSLHVATEMTKDPGKIFVKDHWGAPHWKILPLIARSHVDASHTCLHLFVNFTNLQ